MQISKVNMEEILPDKPLEELIDTSNIHGWLQGKIHSAERRMAAWTKLLIDADEKNYQKLDEVYKAQGILAAKEIKAEGNYHQLQKNYSTA